MLTLIKINTTYPHDLLCVRSLERTTNCLMPRWTPSYALSISSCIRTGASRTLVVTEFVCLWARGTSPTRHRARHRYTSFHLPVISSNGKPDRTSLLSLQGWVSNITLHGKTRGWSGSSQPMCERGGKCSCINTPADRTRAVRKAAQGN